MLDKPEEKKIEASTETETPAYKPAPQVN